VTPWKRLGLLKTPDSVAYSKRYLLRSIIVSHKSSQIVSCYVARDFREDYDEQARLLPVLHLFGMRRICLGR